MLFVWMSCNRQLIWYYFTGLRLCTVYLTKCVQCFTMLCFGLVVQSNVSNKAGEVLLQHMNFTTCIYFLHTSFTVVVPILMKMSYSLWLLWGIGQSYNSHINVSKATLTGMGKTEFIHCICSTKPEQSYNSVHTSWDVLQYKWYSCNDDPVAKSTASQ